MNKAKIAIAIDKELLRSIDSRVDKDFLRSRSQAIEYFLKKGLQEVSIDTAVILIKGSQLHILLRNFKNKPLIYHQLEFFINNGIKKLFISTQHNNDIDNLRSEIRNFNLDIELSVNNAEGNAQALFRIKDKVDGNFVVMSGDTLNNFELKKMVRKHLSSDKLATIGLMSVSDPKSYGNVILEGDMIVDFAEKPKVIKSNIANAGIYIFKKEVFELFGEKMKQLEIDLFPKLAKINQIVGYFTMGEYWHFKQ